MNLKKIAAVFAAAACMLCCASCEKNRTPVSESVSIGENGVSELITPEEESEEYALGSYRLDKNGVKLYYDDSAIPAELMLALENYFMSFQNNDFEAYKQAVASDYVQRYDKYLREDYSDAEGDEEYTLESSFNAQCDKIRKLMLSEINGDSEAENIENYSGDFKITRIRGERSPLPEDETEESRIQNFFSNFDEIFGMDYYSFVSEQADGFEYLTFFIIAEGEDGEEHLIISEFDIVFAEKDGKYYTFG